MAIVLSVLKQTENKIVISFEASPYDIETEQDADLTRGSPFVVETCFCNTQS